MSEVLLTIFVPCFNAEAHLPKLFASFEDFPEHVELLFIDDCSSDSTPRLLAAFCGDKDHHRVITHLTNLGPGGGCNSAMASARGRYIQRCDADDVPLWDGIRAALVLAEANSPAMIAQPYFEINGKGDRALRSRQEFRSCETPLKALWAGAAPSLWATMFSLDLIRRLGTRFPAMNFGEDHLWLLRLCMAAPEVKAIVSETPSYEYIHQENSLANYSGAQALSFTHRYRPYFAALEALCYEAVKLRLISAEDEGQPLVQRAGDFMRALRKAGKPLDALCVYRSIASRFGSTRAMKRELRRNLIGLPFFGLIR